MPLCGAPSAPPSSMRPVRCTDMPGDPIRAISVAVGVLGEHPDPEVRALAAWLANFPASLIEEISGIENTTGRSVRDAALRARRNVLIFRLGETASPTRIWKELDAYYGRSWPRDRTKTSNPYTQGDRRAVIWDVFRLWPASLSLRQVYNIMKSSPV
jgi:hypothetical protein